MVCLTCVDHTAKFALGTLTPYAPRSSRFGAEPPSVEVDVNVWRYAILEFHARNDDDDSDKVPRHI